jgi:hypothetical protein
MFLLGNDKYFLFIPGIPSRVARHPTTTSSRHKLNPYGDHDTRNAAVRKSSSMSSSLLHRTSLTPTSLK